MVSEPIEPTGPAGEPDRSGATDAAVEAEAVADAVGADGPGLSAGAPAGAGLAATGRPGLGEHEVAEESGPPVGEDRIVRADVWATGVFAVVSIGAAAWSGLLWPAVAVDVALFVAGAVAFLYAYFRGIGRSREEKVTLAGLFFLAEGVAPRPIARALRALLAVQVVVAVATAAARPFSSLAFGVLAPMFGLAMLAVWGAAHGRFPPRPPAKRAQATKREGPRPIRPSE